jgi:hypothetical protein
MATPLIFETCQPREDVLAGAVSEASYAADLEMVLEGKAPPDYLDPARFFAHTHPTRGLKRLLESVFARLSGSPSQIGSIFRLDTRYGGGKTHALIALSHVCRSGASIPSIGEFVDPSLIPSETVRIAAYDGQSASATDDVNLGEGVRARTPWGEIAYRLGGVDGYNLIKEADRTRTAPGSRSLQELIGDRPTLILLDELSVYLRKLQSASAPEAADQITAFLTALFKAVESSPRACVVFTLAIDQEGKAGDAYQKENQKIAQIVSDILDELESVAARKATLLDPTEEDETIHVLQRRLFESIDADEAEKAVTAYKQIWSANESTLPTGAVGSEAIESFRKHYPFHPEVLHTLRSKTATLKDFQRVRGMLRLLARTVADVWNSKPNDAHAIHLHHISLKNKDIRQEIFTRLAQGDYAPAVSGDVEAPENEAPSIAQQIDKDAYAGLPPYTTYLARTVFLHTLAFNQKLQGIDRASLRYSMVGPALDIGFIDDAAQRFIQESGYRDDKHDTILRFLTDINLNQLIRREARDNVEWDAVRSEINDKIRTIYQSTVGSFDLALFPATPQDVPDDASADKPVLVVIGYDAASIGAGSVQIPDLVERLYLHKGASNEYRKNRNNVVFLVVDEQNRQPMLDAMRRQLALENLRKPDRRQMLQPHQQQKIDELYQTSKHAVAVTIQAAYRHLFYPSRDRVDGASVDLAHSAIAKDESSADPGKGHKPVERLLRNLSKLRVSDDDPDSPDYIRDKTPLKSGRISVAELRREFRRDPALPILVGNDVFIRGIRNGVDHGDYVYQKGDLLYGQGDPWASIEVDENAVLYTAEYAGQHNIWPRIPEPVETGGVEVHDDADETGGDGPAPPPEPTPNPVSSFRHSGTLKECLTRLWEQRLSGSGVNIASMTLSFGDHSDAFRALGVVGVIANADKRVKLEGSYETKHDSSFGFDFNGGLQDAQVVKEFVETQFRAAREADLNLVVVITFHQPMDVSADSSSAVRDGLTRLGLGAAMVTLSAEYAS